MIIDFHTHCFPDDIAPRALERVAGHLDGLTPSFDGTRRGLKEAMDTAGVTMSVTLPVATKETQVLPINDAAMEDNGPPFVSFGTLFPGMRGADRECRRLAAAGIRGVKLHPEYQEFAVDDPRVYPLYDAIRDAGLIVVFHAGDDPLPTARGRALPAAIRRVSREFSGMTIVAAHMGGWRRWEEATVLADTTVFVDTSAVYPFMPHERFCRLVSQFGSERVLFGSDAPWFSPWATVRWIESAPLTQKEKERIFAKNARELLTG